jgi:hypothetical protein
MVRRSANNKKKEEMQEKRRLGDLDKVIAGIEKLVDTRMEERGLISRVGTFENYKDLKKEELKGLPKAAEWATNLREALESGNLKKLERV